MLKRVSELEGAALDWAVAKCEGFGDPFLTNGGCLTVMKYLTLDRSQYAQKFLWEVSYSTKWELGGKIIEREKIGLGSSDGSIWPPNTWIAAHPKDGAYFFGPTPIIAAMRCYVASKLGDEIEIPIDLL